MPEQAGGLTPAQVLQRFAPHDGTLHSALRTRAAVQPDHVFLMYQGEHTTYAQALQQETAYLRMLQQLGVRAGDKVGVMSPGHPSTVFLLFALARLGAVLSPVNPQYQAAEARYIFENAEVVGVFCAPELLDTAKAAVAGLPRQPWVVLNRSGQGARSIDELTATAAAHPQPVPGFTGSADEVCIFIYTSGTTGYPKGVMHSQYNLITAGEGFVERMHLQPSDRQLCVLPLFHINAIFYSLMGSLAAGCTLILEPRFSATQFWQTVKTTGATAVNTIAAANTILINRPDTEFVSGHSLRKIYGAPFDEAIHSHFNQRFNVPTLIEGYGMSEIPGVLSNPFDGPRKVACMGKPCRHPLRDAPLAEVMVFDDDGQPVPVGQTGELAVRTPIIMKGYYKNPEQTEAAFRDGWFLTGDLAYQDEDGYFWFVARKKDIIRRRGENISGAELDRVLGSHPDILEAATIGVPSKLGEDDILAAIVLKDSAGLTAMELVDWCKPRLSPIKVPRYVAFVQSLPHTPTHRVAKFELKADRALLERAVDTLAGRPA
ncbi:MAG TPA: AMP-binding protein [Bordetella sp.]|nr:AMP-binding protein [Bordetella sp.]